MFAPGLPNPLENEDEKVRRLESRDFRPSRYWRGVFIAGFVVLLAFAILAFKGLPGSGVILVPIGLGMVIIASAFAGEPTPARRLSGFADTKHS